MNPKIYVAGHRGMVGSAIVRQLLAAGHPAERIVTRTHQELDLTDQAAVRAFFAQGGRRCYVVRAGDPLPYDAPVASRIAQLERLIPGFTARFPIANALEPRTWQGMGHLFGLDDVAFVALPDLPDLCRADAAPLPVEEPAGFLPETFVECSTREVPPPGNRAARGLSAQLYGIAAHDPFTLAGAACVLLAAAVLATAWPTLRAMRIDPQRALRQE